MAIGLAGELTNIADDFLAAFGGDVSYTPAGGSVSSITGIFIDPHDPVEIGGVVYSAQEYAVMVKTSAVAGVQLEDSIVVEGTSYIVADVQQGQTGLTKLELQKT